MFIAKVKEAIIVDIRMSMDSFDKVNKIRLKDLHTFTGKVNHAAGLLVTIRPFLQPLWAALYNGANVSNNFVWKKCIAHSLIWLRAVFNNEAPIGLERHFNLQQFLGNGDHVEIGTDASPHGLGGWLAINGTICKHFSSRISPFEVQLFKLVVGSCDGQQVLEALAILVALRLWLPECNRRIYLAPVIRSDNITALTLCLKMRPRTWQLAIVGRELALCLTNFSFLPQVYHTPGIANVIPDLLSRMDDPSKPEAIDVLEHPALKNSKYTVAPMRSGDFYKALIADSPAELDGLGG